MLFLHADTSHFCFINDLEQASVELQGIKGMWSLRSSTDDPHDFFLVVSFISETRILAMNMEDELEETEIQGFSSQVQTLFCHDAVFNQLVQVCHLIPLSLSLLSFSYVLVQRLYDCMWSNTWKYATSEALGYSHECLLCFNNDVL